MTPRSSVRRAVGDLLARARRGTPSGRILLYHRIDLTGHPSLSVPPSLFREHLGWIAEAGLRVTTVAACRDAGFPEGQVALSFDDGDATVLTAWSDLARVGWSATLFIVPEWVGREGFLSWADLRALVKAGAEIGAHGLSHEALTGADPDAMATELLLARRRLHDGLGTDASGLAYPFGIAPARARLAAFRARFAYAATTEPGRNTPGTDAHRLRRNEIVGADDSRERLLGKLRGSDDWMRPIRRLEGRLRYGS